MKVFVVNYPRKSLNIRQLLNPLFFTPTTRHPDPTRQRGARQKAKDLAAARRLKAQYVPLCFVDRSCYIPDYFDYERGSWSWKVVAL